MSEENLRELATLCQDSTRRFFDVALDFSPESLALADRVISSALETPRPRLVDVLPWGAYLGEVVVRHLGGRWVLSDEALEVAVVVGERSAQPFRRAAQRLSGGADYGLEACYLGLAAAAPQRGGD